MKKFIKSKSTLQIALTSFIAALMVAGVVSAATTIGTNISTGGSLSVTGTTTLNAIAYVWPSNNGDSNQFLTTDGSGTLTWSTASPSSGGGWTDGGTTVYPTGMSDQFLIGTTTAAGLSQLTVEATSTAAIPLTLRGYNGQTANLLQIQNVAGTNLFTINSSGAITTGAWNGTIIGSAYIDTAVILSTEIDAYSELNAIVNDVTLTHNGLIDSISELNAILTGEDVASTTWSGATSITTLGTIGTGVWQGTSIGDVYLTKTGDWTGTLDGIEGATFLLNTGDTATGDYNFDSGTLMIDSSGDKVGIGTTTPTVSLHIDDGATATSTMAIGDRTSGTGKSCFDLAASNGTAVRAYITGTSWVIEAGTCE